MSIAMYPLQTGDAELYYVTILLQGAGAGTIPTLVGAPTSNAHGITMARTSAGLYTLTFNEDPGPTFEGFDPSFGDSANPATVAGWSATFKTWTPRSGAVKASLVFGTQNNTFVGADMAATSSCYLTMAFKMAPAKL